jgi:hypothetical protein
MAKKPEAALNLKPGDDVEKRPLVTYVPQSGDPAEVTWNSHVFKANIPRTVNVPGMVEQARGNPWFRVGDEERAQASSVTDRPKTAEEYRAYALAWIMAAPSSAELAKRWDDEAALRAEVEAGTDDEEYLAQFFNVKFDQLKKVEAD